MCAVMYGDGDFIFYFEFDFDLILEQILRILEPLMMFRTETLENNLMTTISRLPDESKLLKHCIVSLN